MRIHQPPAPRAHAICSLVSVPTDKSAHIRTHVSVNTYIRNTYIRNTYIRIHLEPFYHRGALQACTHTNTHKQSHTHTRTCMHAHTHAYTGKLIFFLGTGNGLVKYPCVLVYMSVLMYMCVLYVCPYAYVCPYIYVGPYVYVCLCICVSLHTCVSLQTCVFLYICVSLARNNARQIDWKL